MKVKINLKQIFVLFTIILIIVATVKIYRHLKPVRTIYYHGIAFTFRDDVKKALKIPVHPEQELIHDMFWDFDTRNVTILFKPGDSKTNGLYQLEAVELTYKLSMIDNLGRHPFRPKKSFSAEPIQSYENITREDEVLKIILVAPEFTNETFVRAGGNKIYIYGKNNRDFDLATMRTILAVMNITAVS